MLSKWKVLKLTKVVLDFTTRPKLSIDGTERFFGMNFDFVVSILAFLFGLGSDWVALGPYAVLPCFLFIVCSRWVSWVSWCLRWSALFHWNRRTLFGPTLLYFAVYQQLWNLNVTQLVLPYSSCRLCLYLHMYLLSFISFQLETPSIPCPPFLISEISS